MKLTIGVLALQGAFQKHIDMICSLNHLAIQVKTAKELECVDALILPGGESTTTKTLLCDNFLSHLKDFAQTHPLFGTCCGLILLASNGVLPLFNIEVERNAYGRQIDSFYTDITIDPFVAKQPFPAIFIRAPKILSINSSQVEVLARHNQTPVLIQQKFHLGATFHPELTNDPSIHHYFIERVRHAKQSKKRSLHSCR